MKLLSVAGLLVCLLCVIFAAIDKNLSGILGWSNCVILWLIIIQKERLK